MLSQITDDRLAAVRTLVEVVDSGSLTEAGRRLKLTPSAVSKQISRLEQSLGVRLLERSTRSVRATDAGLDLCQRTRPLFEAFAEATSAARDHSRQIGGRVRISASPALGRARVLPALARLADEHPALDFDVVLTGKRLDFFEDDLDVAIREGALDDSSLVARKLGATSVFLFASPAYIRRRGQLQTIAGIDRHDLLLVPAADAMRDLPGLRGKAKPGAPRFRVNDLFALRELAEGGAGVAALPDYVAASSVASGSLVQLLERTAIVEIPIHAVYPSRRHLPRRVAVVIEALGAAFLRR